MIDSKEKERINFLGINVNVLTKDDIIQEIIKFSLTGKRKVITYLNAHCVNTSFIDQDYKKILNLADIVHADGMSIIWTSRLFGTPLPERVHIFDFFDKLIEKLIRYNISFYFLGSRPEVVQKAVDNLIKTFPAVKIKGFHHGYFSQEEEEKEIISEINNLSPDVLVVAMGVPKQEKWVYKHLGELNVNLCWIAGSGAFDNLSGVLKKPPRWMFDNGLGWLYRLLQEPKRLWQRYLIGNLIFVYNVLKFKVNKSHRNKSKLYENSVN